MTMFTFKEHPPLEKEYWINCGKKMRYHKHIIVGLTVKPHLWQILPCKTHDDVNTEDSYTAYCLELESSCEH